MANLPDIQELDSWSPRPAECALFLCALGFEPRCLTIPGILAGRQFKAGRAAYFQYSTNRADNAVNLPRLLESLNSISDSLVPVEVGDHEFPRRIRELLDSTAKASREDEPLVVLDLSVASNQLVMRSMNALLEFDFRLIVVYSEAAKYHPTREEYETDRERWKGPESLSLERGVSNVAVSEEYPGYGFDQLPDCVILLAGFKKDRARAAIGKVDPSLLTLPENKVLWLVGAPHLPEDSWRLDYMRSANDLGSEDPQYEVSTFDYKDSLTILEKIHQERANRFRLTLSAMGSKMQALGAALFCYLRPDVRVVFVTPSEYNATLYSEGCKATWMIDFGPLRRLRELLDEVGQLRVED
jgi:hypothetical protein